jgi:hypothetical protein
MKEVKLHPGAITYQAVTTRYHGPTNTRPSRVTAEAWAGKLTVEWDDSLSREQNHVAAAIALLRKLGWIDDEKSRGPLVGGCLPNQDYVFVLSYGGESEVASW